MVTVTHMRNLMDEVKTRRGVGKFDLPASGPISAGDINEELGRNRTAAFNLGGTEERTLAGVVSGEISFSDFYGKSHGAMWLIEVNPLNAINIGYFDASAGDPYGALTIRDLPTVPASLCIGLFALTTLNQLQVYSELVVTAPDTIEVDITGYGTVVCTKTTGSAWASVADPALIAFMQANVGNYIPVEFSGTGIVDQDVYANKETGGYNRATATAAGYVWSDGSSIYYGWQQSTGSTDGNVIPIPAPSGSTSVVLLSGVDETLYEYALISAPFTITSRVPVDNTTLAIGTWYDIPASAIPTLFAQCHATENADTGNSDTAAGYLTTEWHVRLKGTTDTLVTIYSEIKVRAKSTL